MSADDLALLEGSIDGAVEIETLDGTRLLVRPLFVYTGEDNPDVFFLPLSPAAAGSLEPAGAGRSLPLREIRAVRVPL